MRKPAARKAPASLHDAVASFSPELPLAVAFSGGADSTALLLACAEKWPGQVMAIHVHHGLQVSLNPEHVIVLVALLLILACYDDLSYHIVIFV